MFKHNILFVQDIFSSEGKLSSLKNVKDHIGTKTTFTTYFGIRKSIPKEWSDSMREIRKPQICIKPTVIDWLTEDKKKGLIRERSGQGRGIRRFQ